MLALVLSGCGDVEDPENGAYDPFATGPGAADQSSDHPHRLVPESGAFDIAPNDELSDERIYYQPYTVDQDGNDINIYRPDDAWYQIRRYVMTVESTGHLEVTTVAESALLVDIWQVVSDRNERVDPGVNNAAFDITEPGRYGILVSPSVYPVKTAEEEAYVDYVLQTTFDPTN